MVDHPRLEARAHAFFLVRRAFMQSLMGLRDSDVWRTPGGGAASVGEIVRSAWLREWRWLWPPETPAPELDERPNLAGLLYALGRYRAVTEELLRGADDNALDRVYVSQARRHDGAEPRTLGWILDEVMRNELYDAAQVNYLRSLWQPEWDGAQEIWLRAATAFADRD